MNAASTSAVDPTDRDGASRAAPNRTAAALLLLLLVLGCLMLWIGIPIAGLWLASKLSDSFSWHMPIAMTLILPGMFVMAAVLAWLNALYLRVVGGEVERVAGLRYRRRGPLEPMLVACFVVAIVALFVWFFFLAQNPSEQVI